MSEAKLKPEEDARPSARIYGESAYDRVTSMLLAVVMGALMVSGFLLLEAATMAAYQSKTTRPIQVIEVSGGGGGAPDGQINNKESVEVAGGEAADRASNNEEDASAFEDPQVEVRPAAMLDSVAEAGETLAEVDVATVMPRGDRVARGQRRSKIGNGGPGYGFGPGDGGVRREDRWSILYKNGQIADEYARQLDAFGVELAVVSGNQLIYASHFSQPKPTTRVGPGSDDKRLYFLWRGQGRKQSDVALLNKAGLDVGDKEIFQFYPAQVESTLEQLEVRYKGKQPAEIRSTRFGVVETNQGYSFEVVGQEYLR